MWAYVVGTAASPYYCLQLLTRRDWRDCKLESCCVAWDLLVRHRLNVLLSAKHMQDQAGLEWHSMMCGSISCEISVSIFCSDLKVTRVWLYSVCMLLSSCAHQPAAHRSSTDVWRVICVQLFDVFREIFNYILGDVNVCTNVILFICISQY